MALTPYHCYCCLSHRNGGMLGAIITLLISAASAAFYIWVVLDLQTRQGEFRDNDYYYAVVGLHYFVIALTGIIYPLLALVLFAGAYWYFETPVAFFSIMKSFGLVLELGAIVFFAVTFDGQYGPGDLTAERFILGEIIWYGVRFIYDLHLIFATWALYQENSSQAPQKSSF